MLRSVLHGNRFRSVITSTERRSDRDRRPSNNSTLKQGKNAKMTHSEQPASHEQKGVGHGRRVCGGCRGRRSTGFVFSLGGTISRGATRVGYGLVRCHSWSATIFTQGTRPIILNPRRFAAISFIPRLIFRIWQLSGDNP